MELKTRRRLFFLSFFIFLAASPAIILYSLGYKLDLATLKLQKTGAIFVDTDYDLYSISINENIDKYIKKPVFIQKGTLIPNLIPNSYNVTIKKDGYRWWQKDIKVNSGIVTEIKNIFLIPNNITSTSTDENVIDILLSDQNESLAYLTKTYTAMLDKNDILYKIEKKIREDSKILERSIENNSFFFEDKEYIHKADFQELTISSLKKSLTEKYLKVSYSKNKANFFYALTDKDNLYEISFTEGTIFKIASSVSNFYTTDNYIVYATKEPANFYKQAVTGGKPIQITFSTVKNIDINSKILARFDDPVAILDSNKDLLLFNYRTEKFEKIKEDVLDAKISNDLSKMFFRKEKELYVYYFIPSYPNKKAGETDIIARFSKNIENVEWFPQNNNYIFITIDKNTELTELDIRGQRNSEKITENAKKLIFNSDTGYLYILKDDMNLEKILLMPKEEQ